MKVTLNRRDDALYFRLDESADVVESEEIQDGVMLDFDASGRVIAIEILSVSKHIPADELSRLDFETV